MTQLVEGLLEDYIKWRSRVDPQLRVLHLQNFLTGEDEAAFARAAGVKGKLLETYRKHLDEGHKAFVKRAAAAARQIGALRCVIGGIDYPAIEEGRPAPIPVDPSTQQRRSLRLVRLPYDPPYLHSGQIALLQHIAGARYSVNSCGRRLGKSVLAEIIATDDFALGRNVGLFFPAFKYSIPVIAELRTILIPIISEVSEQKNQIIGLDGIGNIDWWTLHVEDERAGRGREYNRVIFDEAAHNKPSLVSSFETAIRATLMNRRGSVAALSTPNGVRDNEWFFRCAHMLDAGNEKAIKWSLHQSPTHDNPILERDELEAMEATMQPLIYQQEVLAKFVDISTLSIFPLEKLLEDGKPVPFPTKCDVVFATVDTGLKGGTTHDSTAACYFAVTADGNDPGHLIILDYDVTEVAGGGIAEFLQMVHNKLKHFTYTMSVASGSQGMYIEDAAAGAMLLYDAPERGILAQAIDGKLTDLGKNGRALQAEIIVSAGLVRLSDVAKDKVVVLRGLRRNALISQVTSFHVGDPAAERRQDDLLDTFTYGVITGINATTTQNWVLEKAKAAAKARRLAEKAAQAAETVQ